MSSSSKVRTMASLLYEYTIPGLRRVMHLDDSGLLKSSEIQRIRMKGIIPKRNPSLKNVFKLMERAYNSSEFYDYLQYCNDNPNTKAVNIDNQPSITEILKRNNNEMPSQNIQFMELCSDIRMSYQLFDFLHKGKSAVLMGNSRRRFVSYIWIYSTDEERKLCLLNTDKKDTLLNRSVKEAYGQDYKGIIIPKRLKHINWLCDETIKTDRYVKSGRIKKKSSQDPKRSFTLQYDDAWYLKSLYRLDK